MNSKLDLFSKLAKNIETMLASQKDLFSLDPDYHYLNCAYKAPMLKKAEVLAKEALEKDRNPYKISVEDFFNDAKTIRKEFGKLIGTKAENIALIPSTSYGLASVFKNIKAQEGQHALCIENDFPSDYLALRKWCNTHNAELITLHSTKGVKGKSKELNEIILESLTKDTALLIMSSIHWMTGEKYDLKAIGERCDELDIYFIVDGTQSVGAMPMDVEKYKIDALICAAYKWLLGPYSTGLAYYHPKFHEGQPIEDSWINRKGSEDFANLTKYSFEYTEGAGRFNMGQYSNFILLPMLKAGLQQINSWGTENIQEYCLELGRPLFECLKNLGLSFEPEEKRAHHLLGIPLTQNINTEILKQKLSEEKLILSFRGDNLRISLHLFNNEEDIASIIRVLEASKN